jgi:hypothetical protein
MSGCVYVLHEHESQTLQEQERLQNQRPQWAHASRNQHPQAHSEVQRNGPTAESANLDNYDRKSNYNNNNLFWEPGEVHASARYPEPKLDSYAKLEQRIQPRHQILPSRPAASQYRSKLFLLVSSSSSFTISALFCVCTFSFNKI